MNWPRLSVMIAATAERALHVIQKQNGIPLYTGAIAVDDDGRTLTWDWKPVSVNEPVKAVFDRQ